MARFDAWAGLICLNDLNDVWCLSFVQCRELLHRLGKFLHVFRLPTRVLEKNKLSQTWTTAVAAQIRCQLAASMAQGHFSRKLLRMFFSQTTELLPNSFVYFHLHNISYFLYTTYIIYIIYIKFIYITYSMYISSISTIFFTSPT